MRRLGPVVRTANRIVLCRPDEDPTSDVGESVVDESLDRVGRIVDVMGPVARPYVVISPEADRSAASLLGERLYVR